MFISTEHLKRATLSPNAKNTVDQITRSLLFVHILDRVCETWPSAQRARDHFGDAKIYSELNKYPYQDLIWHHIKKAVRSQSGGRTDMSWELCTIIMRDKQILDIQAAQHLLDSLVYLWKLAGPCS